MDKELQEYYENRFTMFTTKGWKDLVEDIDKIKNSIKVEDIPDEKTLMVRKGELKLMNWLLSLENISKEAYKELNNENTV